MEAGVRLRQIGQQGTPTCRMFYTGATGLEPATSGVTVLPGLYRLVAGSRLLRLFKAFSPAGRQLRVAIGSRYWCTSPLQNARGARRQSAGTVRGAIELR